MSALDKIKAEIVAKTLEEGHPLDGFLLIVNRKMWREAARELGLKLKSGKYEKLSFFYVGKVRVESQFALRRPRWYHRFDWEAVDSVLKQAYLPAIRQQLQNSSVLLKHVKR